MDDTRDPRALSDEELTSALAEAEVAERTVSTRRTTIQRNIDMFVPAGGPDEDPEQRLLELRAQERRASDERQALHARIDALRAEQTRRLG
jgi:hypothetical protein